RALFEAPTIARLAERVSEARESETASAPPLLPVSREGTLPLSFAQQRLWFLDQFEPGSPAYNIPIARRLIGPLDAAALEASLTELVRRHEALRTTFSAIDGVPCQVIHAPSALTLPVVDLTAVADGEREAETQRQ